MALLLGSAVFAADEKKAENPTMNASSEVAVIKTSEGNMVVQFWNDAAPNTIENFKKLARSGFYDGTIFHRIVKGFMIQGGDPNSKDPGKESSYGQGGPGYKIKAEFNDRSHERGVISMAPSSDPDSAGSQFFICLGSVPRLDHQYTTFGKLIKGDDVLEKIGDTPVTRSSSGETSKPTKRVVIESIDIGIRRCRAGNWRRDHRVTFREAQRRSLSQYRCNYCRGRQIAWQISQDAHSRRSPLPRKVLLYARRSRISGVANDPRKDRRLRLLGPMVSGGGAPHCASWSREFILSNRHRLASVGKEEIRCGPIFCLGNNSAQSRDREWLLCRGRKSRRPRSACGWGWN